MLAWGQNACVLRTIYVRIQTSACCQVIRTWLSVTGVDELTVTCKVMLLSRASGWGRCLKVLLSWLCIDYRVQALAALYIDLCPLTSLTVSTQCWHRVDIALTSFYTVSTPCWHRVYFTPCLHRVDIVFTLHRVYTVLTSCLHRVVMVLPLWHHSCNNGNCACYRWYEWTA